MARGPGISWGRLERGVYQKALEGLPGHLYNAGKPLQGENGNMQSLSCSTNICGGQAAHDIKRSSKDIQGQESQVDERVKRQGRREGRGGEGRGGDWGVRVGEGMAGEWK